MTYHLNDVTIKLNPETGETEEKEVVETYVNETEELIHVTVDGETITTTPNHPFYVPEKGWTYAVELKAGDQLQLVNGEYVTVEKVQHELFEEPVKVYSFEVEDFHTYYVGTDISVLVHNTCGDVNMNTVVELGIFIERLDRKSMMILFLQKALEPSLMEDHYKQKNLEIVSKKL